MENRVGSTKIRQNKVIFCLVGKQDLIHLLMQIEKLLVEQNCDGLVDKFHFILVAQNFDGSI